MISIKNFMVQTINYTFRFQFVEFKGSDYSTKIFDWKCDYVKNKIVASININDTKNMNKTIEKFRTRICSFNHNNVRFSEHNGKIYLHIIVTSAFSKYKYMYYMIEPTNDSYVIRYSHDFADSKFLLYALQYGFPTDYLECVDKYIKSCKIIKSILGFPSAFSLKGKINENKYYEIYQNKLAIHTIDCSSDTKIFVINLDDNICNVNTLKNKLYMILANNSLCIYDAETDSIEFEYSYDSKTIIEKYGQVLIFRSKYHAKYKIFSLKPEIIKMKYYDIMFDFQ